MPEYVLEFHGEPPAHKNEKMPAMRRRKDGSKYAGLITKPESKLMMDRLALQIPGSLRDLKLRHPDITMQFYVGREDVDKSNMWCAIEDLLWKYGVLVDDSVKHSNGHFHMPPAIVIGGNNWKSIVTLRVP